MIHKEVLAIARRMLNDAQMCMWISVEEDLPPVGESVIVFYQEKTHDNAYLTGMAITHRHIFKIFSSAEGIEMWLQPFQYFDETFEITHWMPLPKPPKED